MGKIIASITSIVLFLLWVWWFGAQTLHLLVNFVFRFPLFIGGTITVLVFGIVTYIFRTRCNEQQRLQNDVRRRRKEESKAEKLEKLKDKEKLYERRYIASFVVAGLGVVAMLVGLFGQSYLTDKQYLRSMQQVTTEQSELSYRDRAPFDVASNASNRYLGDTTGDTTGQPKSLPSVGDRGVYNTSIVRRGFAQGYEATQSLNTPLTGSPTNADVSFCEFNPEAKLRLGGMTPWNNLWRSIAWRTNPLVSYSKSDAFVYCEKDTPYVIVPLRQVSGPIPHLTPYGTAVYNGAAGELTISKDDPNDIPPKETLPLYPQSIAEAQREALTATGSFIDYIFLRSGYEDTTSDENDPNQDNRAEFSLSNIAGNESFYVTPLTSRGSTSSIIALGDVRSDTVTPGKLNDLTVHRFEDGKSRQANSSIAQRITGEVLSGYKAQGLSVFEIVPGKGGMWIATIGNEQSILYRAYIDEDGKITLQESKEAPAPKGSGKDVPSVSVDTGKPLEDMSTQEIKDTISTLVDELASRTQ